MACKSAASPRSSCLRRGSSIAFALLSVTLFAAASEPPESQRPDETQVRIGRVDPWIVPPDPAEIPRLITELKHDDPDVRCNAAATLMAAREQAAEALPALLEATTDPDAAVRYFAGQAIFEVHPNDARVLPALIRLFQDEHPLVRHTAVLGFTYLGPKAAAAVPVIIDSLTERYDQIDDGVTGESWTVGALGAIGPAAKDAVPLLTRIVADRDLDIYLRSAAADSLGEMGPAAVASVPTLAEALLDIKVDESVEFRLTINGLSHWDKTVHLRFATARALGRIGPDAKQAVPALTSALADDASVPIWEDVDVDVGSQSEKVFWTVRAAAARALGHIGAPAKPAIPKLKEMLAEAESWESWYLDEIEPLHFAAAVALLDPSADNALRDVVECLSSLSDYPRAQAAAYLGQIGVNKPFITRALELATYDDVKQVRAAAHDALEQLAD